MSDHEEMNAVTLMSDHGSEHTGHTASTGEIDQTAAAEASHPGGQHEAHGGDQVKPAVTWLEPSKENLHVHLDKNPKHCRVCWRKSTE